MKQGNAAKFFIFVTILVDVIGIGIIIPVVPDLIVSLDGGSISDAAKIGGWLMFAFAIMQFIFAPILGGLSDRFGRKPVLLMALFGLGLDYIFHAFAPTIFWLFVGRFIAGVFGASFTVASAYMADISKPEDKAKNFGLIGAAFGLGFIIGPVIGGIAGQWGVQMPFFIAAGLSLLNVLYGIFVVPESLKPENRRPFNWKRANPVSALLNLRTYPKIMGLVAGFFLIYLAGKCVESVWSFYTMYRFDWDTAHVGYSLGVVGILVTIVQGGLIGKVVSTFGEHKTIFIGYIFWVFGLVLFGLASEGWMMYSFIIVYCLGGVAGPTLQGLISNEVPDN
ncbi:MAG: DHA1 family tetracycline resistance protein-like MFS transporter, partial [Salibacteraceae bacterium]